MMPFSTRPPNQQHGTLRTRVVRWRASTHKIILSHSLLSLLSQSGLVQTQVTAVAIPVIPALSLSQHFHTVVAEDIVNGMHFHLCVYKLAQKPAGRGPGSATKSPTTCNVVCVLECPPRQSLERTHSSQACASQSPPPLFYNQIIVWHAIHVEPEQMCRNAMLNRLISVTERTGPECKCYGTIH